MFTCSRSVKPTKDELVLTGKVTAAVAVVTAIGCIVVQSLLRK